MSSLTPRTTSYTPPKEFFSHDHKVEIPGGVTIDYTTVTTADDGSRVVLAGSRMGKITASDKYGPYNDSAADGRQVGVGLLMYEVDCTEGDELGSIVIHGFVKEAALPEVIDANFKADCPLLKFL